MTKTELQRTERLGELRVMKCGMEAKIIAYRKSDDVDVLFKDGTISTGRRYIEFQQGTIQNPNCKTNQVSMGETAILYYLSQYGYKKARQGTLKEYGLGRFEIDAFNEEQGIGIEYDGWVHKKHLERDRKKDGLFLKHFSRLIRIRDYHLPCDNERVEYYKINTGKNLSSEYEETLRKVFSSLNLHIDVNFKRDKDEIFALYHKNSPSAKVGEKQLMRNGLMAEIIKYRSSQDIDVKFSDGLVVSCTYGNFVSRSIQHPEFTKNAIAKRARLNEIKMMNCGMNAKIIEYYNNRNITVQFEDGVIVTNANYSAFTQGRVNNPSVRHPVLVTNEKNRVGEKRLMHCGMYAEIVEYIGCDDITVKFDDGTLNKHKTYKSFKHGAIPHPNLPEEHIGEIKTMHCGMNAEIIEYIDASHINVKFDDGTIVKNRAYSSFLKSKIAHPNIKPHSYAKRQVPDKTKHIWERRLMNCGEEAEIIEYNNSNDITVRFDDNVIVSHKAYCHFCHGRIAHPNISRKSYYKRKQATTA